jgi:hypothetical protein
MLAMGLLLTSCTGLGIINEVITTAAVSTVSTTTPVTISTTSVATTTAETTPIPITTTTTTTTMPTTLPTINTKEDLLKLTSYVCYPYEVSFNGYIAGVNQQLWTNDDKTPVFGHNAGDTMCIDVYNANDYNTVFSLEYRDEVEPRTFDNGSIVYQPEPRAVNWVTIKSPEITLLPHQILGIPVALHVPAQTICQPNWGFEVVVTDITDQTMIDRNYGTRFLVNMMQP